MEPTLQSIGDYETLNGKKRRTVVAVVLSGLIVGGIYATVANLFSSVDDALPTSDKIAKIPLK